MVNLEAEPVAAEVTGKSKHKNLLKWIEEVASHCKPDRVHLCDGSEAEYQLMTRLMLQGGTAIAAQSSETPRQHSCPLRNRRRRPRRRPHLHLFRNKRRSRTHEQLGKTPRRCGSG